MTEFDHQSESVDVDTDEFDRPQLFVTGRPTRLGYRFDYFHLRDGWKSHRTVTWDDMEHQQSGDPDHPLELHERIAAYVHIVTESLLERAQANPDEDFVLQYECCDPSCRRSQHTASKAQVRQARIDEFEGLAASELSEFAPLMGVEEDVVEVYEVDIDELRQLGYEIVEDFDESAEYVEDPEQIMPDGEAQRP